MLPNRSTIANYNGAQKVNNFNIPPANSTGVGNCDWDNPSLAGAVSDVAALGLTGCRFWCRVVLNTTTGGMSIPTWQAQWMNVTTTAPIPSRVGTGHYIITLPSAVSDEYDYSLGIMNNITLNLLAANVSLEGANFNFSTASASGNIITIYTATAQGTSPADLSSVTALVRAF